MMNTLKKAGLLALALGFAGCATAPEAPPPGQSFAVPQDNPLYAVKSGMNEVAVRNAVGNPQSSHSYTTGKQWIPFYFGPDTARTEWVYEGKGRVVFSRNRYSGELSVVKVIAEGE